MDELGDRLLGGRNVCIMGIGTIYLEGRPRAGDAEGVQLRARCFIKLRQSFRQEAKAMLIKHAAGAKTNDDRPSDRAGEQAVREPA